MITIKDNWEKLIGNNEAAMDRALNRMSIDIERLAKQLVPVKKGILRSSGHHQKTGNLSYKVYFNSEYAMYVELGVKGHMIAPKRKPFLAFQVNGVWVYTKKAVFNPGFKGRFYLTQAVNAIIAKEKDYIMQEAQSIKI